MKKAFPPHQPRPTPSVQQKQSMTKASVAVDAVLQSDPGQATSPRPRPTKQLPKSACRLPREDWDFSYFGDDWPEGGEGGLRHAWAWELDRELGSGNDAFILHWGEHQVTAAQGLVKAQENEENKLRADELQERLDALLGDSSDQIAGPPQIAEAAIDCPLLEAFELFIRNAECVLPLEKLPLRSRPLGEVLELMRAASLPVFVMGRQTAYSTIHALEIDWNLSSKELVKRFEAWLEKSPCSFYPSYHGKKSAGQGNNYAAWFTWLSIWRLSETGGHSRKEIERFMASVKGRSRMAVIPPRSFAKARSEIKERVKLRKQALQMTANNAHHWGGSSCWADNFAKMP